MRMLVPFQQRSASPWSPFRSLESELDRLFNGLSGREEETWTTWSPAVDLREDETAYHLEADLPGVAQKDVTLSIENNIISLKGERKREEKGAEKGYRYIERTQGSFERAFRLPEGVDAEKVTASYEHGVLHVTIPKPEQAKPKQIEVKVH